MGLDCPRLQQSLCIIMADFHPHIQVFGITWVPVQRYRIATYNQVSDLISV